MADEPLEVLVVHNMPDGTFAPPTRSKNFASCRTASRVPLRRKNSLSISIYSRFHEATGATATVATVTMPIKSVGSMKNGFWHSHL